MRVRELDRDVFLIDPGQFAVKLVRRGQFAHVELGLEGADGGMAGAATATVGVVIVEQAEDGTEVVARGEAWEERHVVEVCDGGFLDEGGGCSWLEGLRKSRKQYSGLEHLMFRKRLSC